MFYSVFIPHVFPNIKHEHIAQAFTVHGYGIVKSVDFVSKTSADGKISRCAFVHFTHWFKGEGPDRFREKIEDPEKQARIVYDDPWFWIVLPNTGKKVERDPCADCAACTFARSERYQEPMRKIVETTDFVSASYVSALEKEISMLREENALLRRMTDQVESEMDTSD
uniref:Uncharacterized protein n=1 Tax=viral metagenome TaxID=1070528 RepID=A0A6C0BA89_9ZZZZ